MNKILIIGKGYVGSAVASIFKKEELVIVDPKYSRVKLSDLKNQKFKVIFVSVDTPKEDNFKLLQSVVKKVNKLLPGNIVCCKSTALPFIYEKINRLNKNISVIHYPEFLSHNTNIKDFKAQKFIILGGERSSCKVVSNIIKYRLKKVKKIIYTDIKTAALVKYASNSFLASKITFFNELYKIFKKCRITSTFSTFVDILTTDTRIGKSHTIVPGTDGKFGWGGHCFNKDILHLYRFSNSVLLKYILNINKQHRNLYV